MMSQDDILHDLFHGCSLAAYVEAAIACKGWPSSEAVRQHAYHLYEKELARRHASRTIDRAA